MESQTDYEGGRMSVEACQFERAVWPRHAIAASRSACRCLPRQGSDLCQHCCARQVALVMRCKRLPRGLRRTLGLGLCVQ